MPILQMDLVIEYIKLLSNMLILYDDNGEILAKSYGLCNIDPIGIIHSEHSNMKDILQDENCLYKINQLGLNERAWVKFRNNSKAHCGHTKLLYHGKYYHTIEFFGYASPLEKTTKESLEHWSQDTKFKTFEQTLMAMLDIINTNIYVSDVESFEVLFVNKMMRETFNINDYKGKKCYEIFQAGINEPCNFCPIYALEDKEVGTVITWEERNSVTGQFYKNYDSIVKWIDGRMVHIQDSRDITPEKMLSNLASSDELTGVLNRRAGYLQLQRKHDLAILCEKKLSLCYIDINNLKKVNDSYGHKEGDTLITNVCEVIKSCIRGDDIFCRIGGDEFFICFYDIDKAQCEKIMKRVTEKLSKIRTPYETSISYGIITIDSKENIPSLQLLINMADNIMYQNKKEMKNS